VPINQCVNWPWFNRSAQQELPELESFGISFVNSPHPMWVYDLETLAFLEVNDTAIRAYGFSREEFMMMTLLDIRPPEEIAPFLHSWQHPRDRTEEIWKHVGKDGRAVPVSITSWELDFRGRKAELVMARRDLPDDAHLSHDALPEPSSIHQNAIPD